MTFILKNILSENLAEFEKIIAASQQKFVRLTLINETPSKITQSKIGGNPALPLEFDYPLDVNNKEMLHLAQINFEEMPAIEGFPKKGVLQFYISAYAEMMGLDFDEPTQAKNFRVLYHENINPENNLQSDFSFLDDLPFSPIRYKKPKKIKFELGEEVIGTLDYRFATLVGEAMQAKVKGDAYYDLEEEYADAIKNDGHKIGGYPTFTQEDPREDSHEVLLLQIDTDEKNGVVWGDMGVCNFFINSKDLEKLDFSNVWYNWDCL